MEILDVHFSRQEKNRGKLQKHYKLFLPREYTFNTGTFFKFQIQGMYLKDPAGRCCNLLTFVVNSKLEDMREMEQAWHL